MSNNKKLKLAESDAAEIPELEIEESLERDKKADRFFEELPQNEEIKISVYRKNPGTKKFEKCGESYFLSEKTVDFDEIAREWGSGTYMFYAHHYVDGKMKLYDSCCVTFAKKPENNLSVTAQAPVFDKKQILDELAIYKDLFSGNKSEPGNDLNAVLFKLMEMQASATREMLQMQSETKKEFYDLISNLSNKKESSFDDLMKHFELFQTLNPASDGALEKILPLIAPSIPTLINGVSAYLASPKNPTPPGAAVIPQIQAPQAPPVDHVQKFVDRVPANVKEHLTDDNKHEVFELLLNKYPDLVDHSGHLLKALNKIIEIKKSEE